MGGWGAGWADLYNGALVLVYSYDPSYGGRLIIVPRTEVYDELVFYSSLLCHVSIVGPILVLYIHGGLMYI